MVQILLNLKGILFMPTNLESAAEEVTDSIERLLGESSESGNRVVLNKGYLDKALRRFAKAILEETKNAS